MKIVAEIQDWITYLEFCVYMSHCYQVLPTLWLNFLNLNLPVT